MPHHEGHLVCIVCLETKKTRKKVYESGHGKHPAKEDGGEMADDYTHANKPVCTLRADTTNHDVDNL